MSVAQDKPEFPQCFYLKSQLFFYFCNLHQNNGTYLHPPFLENLYEPMMLKKFISYFLGAEACQNMWFT